MLIVIVLVGPAFLTAKTPKSEDWPVLTIMPDIVTDQPFTRLGGGARPQPPAPNPPAPQPPQAQPITQKEPDPPKVAERQKDETESLEPSRKKPNISLKTVVRNAETKKTTKQPNKEENQAKEFANERRRMADQILNSARSLRNGLSSATEVNYVGEGSGPSVATYAQLVKSIYEQAWFPPDDTANDDAITKVSVTIASDGRVTDAHIVGRCGEPRVDGSVQRTLDRVTTIAPFPEGAKDKERTYVINFNLKAKRGNG